MSRFTRLGAYTQQMFPPLATVPFMMAFALAVHFGLQALGGQQPIRLTWRALAGATSVYLFGLLLRVYDEIKDAPSDLALAQAGDPRYVDRPIVKGTVTLDDLRAYRLGLIVTLFALNISLGFPYASIAFGGTFLFVWLSSRWFFWPAVSKSLLLAVLTHNPLLLALVAYMGGIYIQDFGLDAINGWALPLAIGIWLPWAAWETSRKIRIPEDETAYESYSKIFGRRAPLVPAALVLISLFCLLPALRAAGANAFLCALLSVAAAVPVLACMRFRLAPSREHARLRPYVDVYSVVVYLGVVIALGLQRGIHLG
ncbi:hypothetical protein LVJ94_33515 [Pendulispora rubella]|uniref:Prenyltransferase n=2 Tax=Pendulispora rubella TaxID=2741070 RepID=A0ABZ2KT34_9BACT